MRVCRAPFAAAPAALMPGQDVRTVPEMGWSGKKNGELLPLITAPRFDLFLTTDQNLRYQQNLRAAGIAVVVLVARTSRFADLAPLMPQVRATLPTVQPGDAAKADILRGLAPDFARGRWPARFLRSSPIWRRRRSFPMRRSWRCGSFWKQPAPGRRSHRDERVDPLAERLGAGRPRHGRALSPLLLAACVCAAPELPARKLLRRACWQSARLLGFMRPASPTPRAVHTPPDTPGPVRRPFPAA